MRLTTPLVVTESSGFDTVKQSVDTESKENLAISAILAESDAGMQYVFFVLT